MLIVAGGKNKIVIPAKFIIDVDFLELLMISEKISLAIYIAQKRL
jgi:hypothetical protein